MLAVLGLDSLDQLTTQTVPADILRADPLPLPGATPEHVALAELAGIAGKNVLARSFIGLGYHPTLTPNVTSLDMEVLPVATSVHITRLMGMPVSGSVMTENSP